MFPRLAVTGDMQTQSEISIVFVVLQTEERSGFTEVRQVEEEGKSVENSACGCLSFIYWDWLI